MLQRTLVLQRERGAVQKRKLQDPGDSEPLSNLLGRLEIQGGGKDEPAACGAVTPAGVGKYDAASQGVSTKQRPLYELRETGIVTASERADATTPRLHPCP